MTDLTLNIRGQQVSTPDAAAALKTLGSRWALVESNPGMARELAVQGWRIVYRDYWPGSDDNLHDRTTPAEWVAHMVALDLPEGAYWYCGNEPTHDYEPLQDWLLEAMRLARAKERRLVVGNFSTGLPGELDWRDLFGPLLDALADGWHVLGLHEYLCVAYALSKPWHVGRFQFLLDACKQDKRKPPRIMITESGFDLSGSWQSMGLSAATFAAEVGLAMREVYRPAGIEAVFLFSMGAWQNKQGWEFDVTPALGGLAKIGQGEAEIPMDMTTREAGTVRPANGAVNIRAAANGNVVGSLTAPVTARRTVEAVAENNLYWRHYQMDNGVAGWMADSVIAWEPAATPAPEPEPPVDEPPAPVVDGLELMRNLREMLQTQRHAIDVMLEYIEQEMDAA